MQKYIDKDKTLRRDLVARPIGELLAERAVLLNKVSELMGADRSFDDDRNRALHYEHIEYDSAIDAVNTLSVAVAHAATAGANINQTALNAHLHDASKYGRLEECRVLLDSGAEIAGQETGLTALHYAAAHGHPEVCDLLIERGANLGAETTGGLTPFQFAVRNGQSFVVDYFVEKRRESLGQLTSRNETLDELAQRAGDNGEMVRHLMGRRSESTAVAIEAALDVQQDADAPCVQPARAAKSFSL